MLCLLLHLYVAAFLPHNSETTLHNTLIVFLPEPSGSFNRAPLDSHLNNFSPLVLDFCFYFCIISV